MIMKKAGPDRLIVVGVLTGAHGVRGDVRVKSFTDDPDALFRLGPLLSETGDIVLEASAARPAKDHYIVTPIAPREKEEWDAMKGTHLHVRRSSLPPPEDDEFYVEDLVGLAAYDDTGAKIGQVKAVQNFGAGDLLEIKPDDAATRVFFVPFTLEDVPEVRFEDARVTLKAPEVWADQSGRPEEDEA